MPVPINPLENKSTYFINSEDPEEQSRLLLQGRKVTQEMGGIFQTQLPTLPENAELLDLGCGVGDWVLDVARQYPTVASVTGVDTSHRMIAYAQAQATTLNLSNALFQVMNILEPLAFPDAAFHFVNARLISSFMPVVCWGKLIAECLRILVPSGTLRITEAEWVFSNSVACERMAHWITQAMWLDGKGFVPDGTRMGAPMALRRLMEEGGLVNIGKHAYALEYSYGTQNYDTWFPIMMLVYKLLFPFLLKMKVATQEELEQTYTQVEVEMRGPNFLGTFFLLSVWGQKPGE